MNQSMSTATLSSYAHSKGAFAGVGVAGARIKVRDEVNLAFYGA